jgi:ABC-type multidrug transport system ATPase subunit
MSAPLLRAVGARLAGDALALGNLEADGPRLVLVGEWAPLFELLAGRRTLADGALELAGAPAEGAAARGHVGVLLREPPMPPSWTLRDLLIESAALLGHGPFAAARRARRVLDELGLGAHARRRLSRLGPFEQRAAGVAQAVLGDPPVVALEQPFFGLEPSAQNALGALLERALAGRRVLVGIPLLPGSPSEDALAATSDELLIVSQRQLVARTRFRELGARAQSYRVSVRRCSDALLSRLAEAGYEVRRMLTADVTTLLVTDPSSLGTVPLFGAALASGAAIIELVPTRKVGTAASRDAAGA